MNLTVLAALASMFLPGQNLPDIGSILGQGQECIYSEPYQSDSGPYG